MLSYRVLFFTLYSLGLRLSEWLRLEVVGMDGARGLVHVRNAKGNKDRLLWHTKRVPGVNGGYLSSYNALAKVFRAKILAGIALAGLPLPAHHPVSWVVDCKSVDTGDKAPVYPGRYLYRGVIAEKNIVTMNDGRVSFR